MTSEHIEEAVNRNKTYDRNRDSYDYNQKYYEEKRIREICSKINYTREDLGNGRKKHTINGKEFSFPESNEFTLRDMIKDGNYTMDTFSENGEKKYNKFQTETGMNRLSPKGQCDILREFAKVMGIRSATDHV